MRLSSTGVAINTFNDTIVAFITQSCIVWFGLFDVNLIPQHSFIFIIIIVVPSATLFTWLICINNSTTRTSTSKTLMGHQSLHPSRCRKFSYPAIASVFIDCQSGEDQREVTYCKFPLHLVNDIMRRPLDLPLPLLPLLGRGFAHKNFI
jgi:hypothetical protein